MKKIKTQNNKILSNTCDANSLCIIDICRATVKWSTIYIFYGFNKLQFNKFLLYFHQYYTNF